MKKILFRVKYPKLLLLILTFVIAYFLFTGRGGLPFLNYFSSHSYFGAFFAGIFFAYGFTAAPATVVLLILSKGHSILFVAIIAGFGAFLGDLIIFRLIRSSFSDELKKLSREKVALKINRVTPNALKKYFIPVFAGFIIASPLPDEIGVSLFAASRNISTNVFFIISYLLNTLGIFVILSIGSMV